MEEYIRGLFVAFSIALIVFGICVRFVNLDRKFYTNDEATASLHVAGHTIAEYAATVFDGRPRTVDELSSFQRADATTTGADVVRSLAAEDPQHPPLFYLSDRVWTAWFGNGVAARRSFSAACGALAIAAIAWLAWELFGTFAAALACATLVAVSPFHVVYAQQTREYALWTLLLAVSSAMLLVALRRGALATWAAYALVVALGLYADAFFLLTIVAHAVYVAVSARSRRSVLIAYGSATLAALAAFGPWLAALWRGSRAGTLTNNTFLGSALSPKLFALKWLFNAGAVFFDLDYRWHAAVIVLVPVLGFAVAAVVALARTSDRRAWSFVALTGGVAALALLVPDLLHHESRSTSARYLIPLWIAIELAVGWYLATLWGGGTRARMAGVAAAGVLAIAGVGSCVVASGATTWWGDSSVGSLVPVAAAIAREPHALVDYRATWTTRGGPGERWDFAVAQLADVLPGSVRFRQLPKDAPPAELLAPGTTFVLDPTQQLVRDLADRRAPLALVTGPPAAGSGAVETFQSEAKRARVAAGISDFEASLWRPRNPT